MIPRRVAVVSLCLALLVGALPAAPTGAAPRTVDLQAHRGGLGLQTESTLEGFSAAMRLGVTTLELDTQVTRDRKVVITHDRKVDPKKCADTAPATAGDPQYPYVGKYVRDLTYAQIRTMNCGYEKVNATQRAVDGARMPQLHELFDLVRVRRSPVRMNIETKVEAGAPSETAPRGEFVRAVAGEITRSGLAGQVTIQSFDWTALREIGPLLPGVELIALTNGEQFLQTGKSGASPWLGLDVDAFGGDWVRAAQATIPGLTAISPVQGDPQDGGIGDPGFARFTTAALIRRAHDLGLKVIPWTVNDPATMRALIDDGVDGLITDYPDRARVVLRELGIALPAAS
ncbi:glycerophosphodiester phosphodiesterase family protein [Tsukamurella paurometabola]|uniref:Glycerophosphodiester phosphodiesterase n=1 Tax=Tsukamurella paurometabola TaxID=2061 RepID=A0A3P8L5B3_TSUPA|nr:glycerophosphodiester phosphodiesterase family protein [Tsukamurella paurometabola]MBS4099710.1 glycerophosphodiester phosphodiesterase [Tsukamurella paurometabola]UEA83716.1 glycerophosphodiester phosphodiesterase [Tsukamurella paurometabola]VDR40855.1 Glycerophosphoryl diester phosphodiesterase precursor [Tsukamurella paurometabola]